MTIQLLQGDCLERMKEIESRSIDLTVTSPPYDDLRTYNDSLVWNENIWKSVIKELFRVTKIGGVVVWVVGDATIKGSETGTSFRQALYAMECGFRLHDTMIYEKENYMPLNHNRYEQAFEYMFVFSVGKPKTFSPIKIPCKTAGASYNYATRSSASSSEKSGAVRARDKKMITASHKPKGNIWGYQVGRGKSSNDDIWQHPATFPEQLANDHIISWSNEGDTVLDPFMGSGTTGKMALLNNRNFIGIEKDDKYFEIAKNRIADCISKQLVKSC